MIVRGATRNYSIFVGINVNHIMRNIRVAQNHERPILWGLFVPILNFTTETLVHYFCHIPKRILENDKRCRKANLRDH